MKYDLITDNIQVENICFGDVVMIDGEFHGFWAVDTYYIVNLDTLKVVSFYKHLGRSAESNERMSEKELFDFFTELKIDLKSYGVDV